MKKITLSIVAIAMTLAMVTSTALALFTSTATVSGVTFSTGNALLQVWNGGSWVGDYDPSNFLFQNMYPKYDSFQAFALRNSSTSAISLKLNAKLRDGSVGSWNELKDVVQVRLTNEDGTIAKTSWHTLSYWNTNGADFDTGLNQNEQRWYRFQVRVPSTAGNEISGLSLSGIKFDFLGTQE